MNKTTAWSVGSGTAWLCAALLTAAVPAYSAGKASLSSPWDSVPVKATDASYDCPTPTQLPVNFITNGFYASNDPTHSIIDPGKMKAYAESSGPVKHDGDVVVHAADVYRTTGSLAAARCVVEHLEANARGHALTGKMSSNQAYYVQGWVLGGEAIAYLKVRDSGVLSPAQRTEIIAWMQQVSRQTRGYYDEKEARDPASQNNHYYWAALELAAVGIAADDRKDLKWAMSVARQGVAAIRPDGTLPNEMRRGKRALHYHLYAAAPLVTLAELGLPNGVDLYSANSGALKHLVHVSIQGMIDPSLFEKATGIKQEVQTPSGESIGWAASFNRRFPDPAITRLLDQCRNKSYMYLGGLPPA